LSSVRHGILENDDFFDFSCGSGDGSPNLISAMTDYDTEFSLLTVT